MNSPYEENEDMKQQRGDYEPDPTSAEEWAEDHGYSRYRCPVHGTFWSDSQDVCPSCEESHNDDTVDLSEAEWMQLLLASWHTRMIQAARETTQGKFLMDSLKDNGIIPRWSL